MEPTPLEKAIQLCEGISEHRGQAALADVINVSPMTITQWKKRGIPAKRCVQIEAALDRKITRNELRPDLFGQRRHDHAA